MNGRKDFYDISWQVDEPTYRADSALSYSKLAKYERSGFNELSHLDDKISTPSLTFGSAVDSIITGGQQEFDERFFVADFPEVSDKIIKIVKILFNIYGTSYNSIDEIPDKAINDASLEVGYYPNWREATRVKDIKTKGEEYYNLLFLAGDKEILSTSMYTDVINSVRALKESPSTAFMFADDDPFDDSIRRYYQLKFKWTDPLTGVHYRSMADLIIVDYKNKIVYPKDLKTSSHKEWEFHKSFKDWRYDIQARLYWRGIRATMDKDPYFKDFKLADYEFIVVNKETLTPLVWNFPMTTTVGSIRYGDVLVPNHVMRDPYEIGEELSYYLNYSPKVPKGIYTDKSNNIMEWLNK